MTGRLLGPAGIAGVLLLLALPLHAARGEWVRGETRFNLRTGPGVNYRITGNVERDEPVQVTARESGWAQVRSRTGAEGWLLARYLQQTPPDALRIERNETELASVREEAEGLKRDNEQLRQENERLRQQETDQGEEVRRLTEENLDLKAGERWPYLITGAAILVTGMLAGALFARAAGRRPQPRIRL